MFRMSLYAHPHVRASGSYFGYAYTYQEIAKHLRQYEYNGQRINVDVNSPKSKVQLYYGSPHGFFYPHQYKIQMTQWESTLVPPHWVDHAKEYDEWWTANKFGADAFINAGVPAEKIHVFEHGVDSSIWTPKKRGTRDTIRFLHIDSGSPRKRAPLAVEAFKKAFGDNPDYEITLKYSHGAASPHDWFDEKVLANQGDWEGINIRHIRENMTIEHLISLFHFHDILIYPSEGEGFGLIPLQALATGMPVISTSDWCSYDKYFSENIIESHRGQSDVVETYTRFGDVIIPHLDSIIYLMKKAVEDFETQANKFYNQTPQIVQDYDWQYRTNLAIDSLIDRVGINMFENSGRTG
jgi:glycosyltransferase involved in cell wall biosynthesis